MEANSLLLSKQTRLGPATIKLAASKSLSNRALILNALCLPPGQLQNLSEARDTQIMLKLLKEPGDMLDARDAGTTMRFLTAYLSLTGTAKQLTGTPRMQQRPIKLLVDALRKIGADISYLKQEGFPPLAINGFPKQLVSDISIPGNISSQYISALLMMAPTLPQGLNLHIEGKLMSRPYVLMTLGLMRRFGVTYQWEENNILIGHQPYRPCTFMVESDWSAASYWYSFMALSQQGKINLLGLQEQSLQGDRQIADIMAPLGVASHFHEKGVTLSKSPPTLKSFSYDFSDCPDLAQTVLTVCAATGVTCEASGLESLRIKETDRIFALQQELAKIGAKLSEHNNTWVLEPADMLPGSKVIFETYEDHRMAMALAPLAMKFPVEIQDPKVVEKSYPGFWKDLATAGIPAKSFPLSP